MASLVERNFYAYLKNIVVGGLDVLLKRNLRTYSLLAFFLALITTMSAMFYHQSVDVEIVFAFTLILTSIFYLKSRKDRFWPKLITFAVLFLVIRSYQPVYELLTPFAQVGVYATRVITDLMTFIIIRDFMSSLGGFVLFFGEKKGRVVFKPVFNVIILFSLFWYYTLIQTNPYTAFLGIGFSLFIFFMINVFATKYDCNVYATILAAYFIYFVYVTIAGLNVSTMMGAFISDFIIILIMFFFIAKTVGLLVNRANLERINPDNIVLMFLGLVLLFHSVAISVSLGGGERLLFESQHKFSAATVVVITLASAALFLTNEDFRDFMTCLPRKRDVLLKVVVGGVKELFRKED